MSVTYCYRCPVCRQQIEYQHSIADTDAPTYCGPCGCAEMRRVPLGGASVVWARPQRTGQHLRVPFVAQDRDGRETVYHTLEAAERGERERTGSATLAQANLRYLRQRGYVPGTRAATLAQALDDAPGGRVGSQLVTGSLT